MKEENNVRKIIIRFHNISSEEFPDIKENILGFVSKTYNDVEVEVIEKERYLD